MNNAPAAGQPGQAQPGTYLRGAAPTNINRQLIVTVAGALIAVSVLAVAVAMTVRGAEQNSNEEVLHHHGVPVTATINNCFAILSGTGVTNDGFSCRADFTLDGKAHNARLTGTTSNYQTGARVAAVTVRSHPTLLATASSVRKTHSHASRYLAAALLYAASAAILAATFLLRRRF